ncbi:hypothetical protein L2E82_31714 [Cichorium intybus]|uniref:Uncharacterized protein n=1 Tax=Cichorium intybus TaxID=13427 RepID=A0ACB9BG01_CICIN|nr:hypothetical protein L2E82_31714 [Cichorium intybus]
MFINGVVLVSSRVPTQASYNFPAQPKSRCKSIRLLADASASFEKNCVRGIQANRDRISRLLHEVLSQIQPPTITTRYSISYHEVDLPCEFEQK